ncbi:hypothetical protein Q2T41_13630 [Maribacter confluentis]|uniref:Uncharacterized protein n=1 Tax=Maribacter confluentis TaxID=1656093 RepID=A0ABT8RS46_9FLAO|nr:hypothetical protein [Maribacter confluentis]MDO1513699.1 hypothetical protein [Maribacter confluentis]
MMDKVIFGDNQFFGVNHMSEQTSIKQAQRFRTADDIYRTLEYVNDIGIKSFMFTTHNQLEPVFEKMKKNPKFDDFKLYPSMPYAHKYAAALVDLGPFEMLSKFTPGNKFLSGLKGVGSLVSANPIPIMQLLVDSEMKLLKGMNVQGIFLLNIVTDLLIGLGMHDILNEFVKYAKEKYNVKAGFFTMNHVKLHDVLVNELKMEEPIIISNINKIGFRMNPNKFEVEKALAQENSYNIAMSFLASGAIKPKLASEYVGSLKGVNSVLFGASTPNHILETKELLEAVL